MINECNDTVIGEISELDSPLTGSYHHILSPDKSSVGVQHGPLSMVRHLINDICGPPPDPALTSTT